MRIKSSNGKFVCAEQGGGIDGRLTEQPALIANRDEAHEWETFTIVESYNNRIAIKVSNGCFVTAEEGGGGLISTNRIAIGEWEEFTLESGFIVCASKPQFCLRVLDDGRMDAAGNISSMMFQFISDDGTVIPAPPDPSDPSNIVHTRKWKGALCIPHALPGIPYGDGQRIWTAAYGCYNADWRQRIREAYRARGYTHFVYNCAGLPYANHYPELQDDSKRVAHDLVELINSGLVPVVCATDDRYPREIAKSFTENKPYISVCFPMWEMNGPLGNTNKDIEEANLKTCIEKVRQAAPDADCYLHFTPGHGSISYANEIDGWKWCQSIGTIGLLAQGSNRFPPGDPTIEGPGLESTAIRLLGLVDLGAPPAWAGVRQLTVKFEYGILDAYNGFAGENEMREYTMQFLTYAPHVVGYCDGGY